MDASSNNTGAGPILKAEEISVRLGGRRIIESISLSLVPGQILAVVGPNGAGKSTLLRALAGVIPTERGKVLLDGQLIGNLSRREVARRLAYLPQETSSSFSLTAEEVVRLGRFAQVGALGSFQREDLMAVDEAIERADLTDLRQRTVPTLSGGERRRVFIARAMAQRSPILVLDEPTSALDVGHACAVLEMLKALAAEKVAIIFSLHDLTLAQRGAGTVLLLDHGRVVGRGEPAKVLTSEAARAAFGVPLVSVKDPSAIVPL